MKKILASVFATMLVAFIGVLMPFTALAAADTKQPSDITSLTATALDKSVKLVWSASTDDVAVKGYKVFYGLTTVQKSGDNYDTNVDAGNVLEYTVSSLENNKKYYFNVVAYDAAGNESAAWAPEASTTPKAGAGAGSTDKTAPQVAKAEALNKSEVKVTFSEEVVLPGTNPENSFTIQDDATGQPLVVLAAKMDSTDTENKIMVLTTDPQTADLDYTLTVGIDIKDKSGNFIISGTSDTASFAGSAVEKASENTAKDLEIVSVESTDTTHVLVNFNKPVVLSIEPTADFEITVQGETPTPLAISEVKLGESDAGVEDAGVILTTDLQEDADYLFVSKVVDESGKAAAEGKDRATFAGNGQTGGDEDTTPPLDVTNFFAKVVVETGKQIVNLTWKMPKENEGDTKEQLLYVNNDADGNYDKADTFEPDVTSNEVPDLTPGDYWFKLTQKDAAGNESDGKTVKVTISETGPELLGLLFVSIGLGRVLRKKKSKK